jgi:hypothetical protein
MTPEGVELQPIETRHLPQLVDLYFESFPHVGPRPPAEVERKLAELFVDGPLHDATLPSLVALDAASRVVGFRGHLRRRWRLGDERLLGTTGTHFMVRRALRRQGISMALRLAWRRREAECAVPRDVGFGDRSTDDGRSFGTSDPHGRGVQLEHYGFEWCLPLRPYGFRLQRRLGPRLPAGAPRRWLLAALRAGGAPRPATRAAGPALRTAPLSAAALQEGIEAAGDGRPLRIDEPRETWAWMLDYLATYPTRGRFSGRVLLEERGAPLGFYCGYEDAGGGYELLALAAPRALEQRALDHVIAECAERRHLFVHGSACARELRPLLERGATVAPGAWASIRSKRPAVTRAFLAMEVLLSGLEGERWL